MKQKTYLDKLMENKEFREKFVNELEKIFIEEDHIIYKNSNNVVDSYWIGYRDCWNRLRDNVAKLIKKK